MTEALEYRAQRLHWDIETLERQGITGSSVRSKHHELAEIYRQRAEDLIPRRDSDAWPDVFAAITHYGEAGGFREARRLIEWALAQCSEFSDGPSMCAELEQLEQWLETLKVPPSLADFARPVPPVPRLAA
jgi:hypothetical protein